MNPDICATTSGPDPAAGEVQEFKAGGAFSSPPHSVELDVELPGNIRYRVRIEGQDGGACVDRVVELMETCCRVRLGARLARSTVAAVRGE